MLKIFTNAKFLGIAYFSLIIIFTVIYSFLPQNSFYHSTIKYEEKSLSKAESQFLKEFEELLMENYQIYKQNNDTLINGYYLQDLNCFSISSEKVNNVDGYYFTIDFIFRNIKNPDGCLFERYKLFTPIATFRNGIGQLPMKQFIFEKIGKGNLFSPKMFFLETNHPLFGIDKLNSVSYYLVLTEELNDKIYLWGNYKFIDGSYIVDNSWRMFYLSTMVITTVGFGDIVPLTTCARNLVAIEAILGVMVIGLFINSIANKIINGRKTRTDL